MTVHAYYRHARSLGPFRAVDCLRLAREAHALDGAAAANRRPAWVEVSAEDGCKLSRAIRVF